MNSILLKNIEMDMQNMDQILILMTTYNGKIHLSEMIESILAQTYTNWKLVISDDGSTDGTLEIIQKYVEQFPQEIVHYSSKHRFGNPQYHFMHLLSAFHNGPYIMFSDQDDVWHPDKLSKTLEKMKQIEKNAHIPAMVHTDLKVVDSELNEIHPSFHALIQVDGSQLEINRLLIHNPVAGCTMMINRALAELAVQNIPSQGIMMHDWWLALIASACGVTGYLKEATIDYRQHGNNAVGADSTKSWKYIFKRLQSWNMALNNDRTFIQAEMLLTCLFENLPHDKWQIISAYAGLAEKRGIARRCAYVKYGFWKQGVLRQISQILFG